MRDYPAQLEVTSPARFDRLQVLLRVAISIGLAFIGVTGGWLVGVLYLVLPLIAAIAISSVGSDRYEHDVAPRVWRVLAWLLQFSAYMLLLVDRFPTGDDPNVQLKIRFTGKPTVGGALGRLVTSIPSGIVLSLLWFVSGILWLIAAVVVLVETAVPTWIAAFQRGVLRWETRLVAYHASFVEEYPPFALDTDEGHGTPLTESKATGAL